MVDVLFVNPPSPDGGIFIRDLCRVGRRSREGVLWPQTALAQLAAMLADELEVDILDCIADGISWARFRDYLEEKRPRYVVTHVAAPTLTNDMYTTFLAKTVGAKTIAFGTHVTPLTRETMEAFPSLDFVLRGEPEMTLVELTHTLEKQSDTRPQALHSITGLAWRSAEGIEVNADRPLLDNLDELPIPLHDRLPLHKYRVPLLKGPYTFVLTSRGCPAHCLFCIKHVMWGQSVRLRSPGHIMEELRFIKGLGLRNVHFEADLFTVSQKQVMELCHMMISENLGLRWTCNSRVDTVTPELLRIMKQAGCWMISWGLESGSQAVLDRVQKGITLDMAEQALRWSKEAGIGSWGYFIIGLPGETEETIEQTIRFAKRLPLDLVLFHVAVPYAGSPLYRLAQHEGWLRVSRWEDYDMTNSTVLEYPHLSAEQLLVAEKRALWAWALRPGPAWTFLRSLADPMTAKIAIRVGLQQLGLAK